MFLHPAQDLPKFIRPAVIEVRYGSKSQYTQDTALYSKLLGIKGAKLTAENSTYSVPVGVIHSGQKTPDIELRLVPVDATSVGANRTITYWEIEGSGTDDAAKKLDEAIKALEKYHYVPAEKNTTVRYPNKGDYVQALLKNEADGADNMLGLVINPPYPRFTDKDNSSHQTASFWGKAPTVLGLSGFVIGLLFGLSIVVGLLLGWGVSRVVRLSLAKRS
ncbi:MAG: hypothetical protein ACRYG7_37715 [Janthinobacterium lividum]